MYQNPHLNYQLQQQQLLQQMQMKQMQNQQNPMQANPQMMQQMLMQMLQANPQMLQQLMTGQMPQQQMPQQNTIQQPQPQQQSVGRYGGGLIQQQQPQPQQQFTQQTTDTRFSSKPVGEEEQVSVSTLESVPKLVVSTKHGSYPLTKKLSIPPKVSPFTDKSLHSSDKLNICYSIGEAVTAINEEFKDLEEVKTLITSDSVIIDDGYSVTTDLTVFKSLFQDDVKGLYKRIRNAYAETTHIETAVMLNRIDEYFTKLTNEYLNINIPVHVNIDRFSLDFNDLLKALRDNFEDEEDDLWEYLTKEIKEIYAILENPENIEDKNSFRFMKGITIVCFKEHHFKAGLCDVKNGLYLIDPTEDNNLFLLTMTKYIFEKADRDMFYFSTSDRELFKFSKNNKDQIFVERQ